MWRCVSTLTLTLLLSVSAPIAAPDPVADCPAGLVCLKPAEAVALRAKVIDLQEKLALAKIKGLRRFGSTVGCGGGLVVSSLADNWEVGAYCGYMWGYRW